MKKVIILALIAALESLVLVGCAADSAPVGATVRLLGSEGSYIDMYIEASSTNPVTAIIVQLPAGEECEVLSGPKTVADVTFWEVDCSWDDAPIGGEGWGLWGWVDVTMLEVLD